MTEQLHVQSRTVRGKRNARRLRKGGQIPVNLYGHGQANLCLSVSTDELARATRHGARVFELVGAVSATAIVREMQWDTFGMHVLHVDLARVSRDERVTVSVPVELRGEAPGTRQGGVLQHLLHEVEIECPAISIPEKLQMNVNHLELDGALRVAQLAPPEGVKILTAADEIVVQCVLPQEQPEEAAPVEGAEPELIGRKEKEAEEAGEEG